MKKIVMLALSILWAASRLLAQNPYWALPPKYVNFNAGGTVATLGAGTLVKQNVANAIFSQTGNLLMSATSTTSSDFRYRNSSDVNTSVQRPFVLPSDFAVVPLPGLCNTYLVPSFDFLGSNTCGSGFPNSNTSFFSKVRFSDNAGHLCTSTTASVYNKSFGWDLGMAVPVTPDISSATRKPYLYLARVIPIIGTNYPPCDSRNYTANDIYLDIFYGLSNTVENSTTFKVATVPSGAVYLREVDLSFDGTKLAFSIMGSNVIYLINNVNDCANGSCTSSNVTTITVSSAIAVNGVEFSPDGTKLFYTKSTSSSLGNQIGYVDLGTSVQSDVASSANLGSSFLEYALDGYMYVSDGSNLKGFSLASTPFTVSKTISGVTNPLYRSVYTLPDQIDGANYSYIGGDCQSGSVAYTTSSPLPVITKVNGTVTASGSASVPSAANVTFTSNNYVLLQPNFSALSGSNFVASIAPCNITCTANGCTSSSFRIAEEEEVSERNVSEEKSVGIHPNPITSGQLHFGKQVGSYSLTNSTGSLIQQGNNANKLDVIGLPKGMYMLRLDEKTEKVIIQ